MEIIVTKLIYHNYQIEDFLKAYSPNALKTEDLEWNAEENKTHKYSEDIMSNDIVFSVRDINTEEDYGFFFLKVETAPLGNKKYTITKVILDENLTKEVVFRITNDSLLTNINGDFERKDYIEAIENYMFRSDTSQTSFRKVAGEVASKFLLEKDGTGAFTDVLKKFKR